MFQSGSGIWRSIHPRSRSSSSLPSPCPCGNLRSLDTEKPALLARRKRDLPSSRGTVASRLPCATKVSTPPRRPRGRPIQYVGKRWLAQAGVWSSKLSGNQPAITATPPNLATLGGGSTFVSYSQSRCRLVVNMDEAYLRWTRNAYYTLSQFIRH